MKILTDKKQIEELLTRSVEEILPTKESLRKILNSGKRLRIYIGTDATGTSLHLGHSTNYMVLERFRRLGHEVIFLVGDFTAQIGDPTDKNESARKQLTRKEVINNVKTWIKQIKPVIDVDNKDNPVKILYNNEWLSALKFQDVLNLSSNFTVQQMIERDMFQKRIKDEKPLYLHELFYPLMQGYDSVAMEVDIEVCGTDQKFNALAGRTLLKKIKNKEKFVFITTLLENPITKEKMMSKSMGTGVFLDFDANKMYGSIMSQSDENMKQLFIDCTWLGLKEINEILAKNNPRDSKMRLAFEITKIYWGEKKAEIAEKSFINIFQKKDVPDKMKEMKLSGKDVVETLLLGKFSESKSEARRLLKQKGIKVNGKIVESENLIMKKGDVIQKGKRYFLKIV